MKRRELWLKPIHVQPMAPAKLATVLRLLQKQGMVCRAASTGQDTIAVRLAAQLQCVFFLQNVQAFHVHNRRHRLFGQVPLRLILRRRKQPSRDFPYTTRPHTLQNRRKLRFQEGIQAFQILPPLRTLQHSGQSVERRAFVQLLVQAERRLHSFRCNNLQILTLFRGW